MPDLCMAAASIAAGRGVVRDPCGTRAEPKTSLGNPHGMQDHGRDPGSNGLAESLAAQRTFAMIVMW